MSHIKKTFLNVVKKYKKVTQHKYLTQSKVKKAQATQRMNKKK